MEANEKTANIFNRGLHTQSKPKAQPDGTYRFALNAQVETNEGDRFSLSNMEGNTLCLTLPDSLQVIGSCLTDTDDILLFSTNNVTSELGLYNPVSCSYSQLIRSSDLEFSTKYPIDCLFRVRKGCERTFYWTDRNNTYRKVNIDSLLDYTDSSSVEDANLNDTWVVSRFAVSPPYAIPEIELEAVIDGGGALKVGSYQFAIQLLDDDLNATNWIIVSRPVPIVDENLSSNYQSIHGGIPIFDGADPEEGAVPDTNKSIRLILSNLDQNYAYYRIAALHSTSTIGKVSEVWLTEEQPITSDSQSFTYGGPDFNSSTLGTLSDINIDNEPIKVVNTHAQVDQALWVAGLTSEKYNWADFQRAASKIVIEAVKKSVQVTNINNPGDPKNPFTPWDTQSLTPDEVVPLSIQYAFADGTFTPAFHIPGRPLDSDYTSCGTSAYDSAEIPDGHQDTLHLPGDGPYPLWKVYNTAKSLGNNRYLMGYHQNENFNYPVIKDCDGNSIWGTDACSNALEGTPIRHHRVPDRRLINIYDASTDSINIIGLLESNVTYPHPDIVGHRILIGEQKESDKTVLDTGILFGTDEHDDTEFTSVPAEEYKGPKTSDDNPVWFASPKVLLRNEYLNGSYFKFLRRLAPITPTATAQTVPTQGLPNTGTIFNDFYAYGNASYDQLAVDVNVPYNSNIYLGVRTHQPATQGFAKPIRNNSFFNVKNVYKLSRNLLFNYYGEAPVLATNKRVLPDQYASLGNLIYFPMHHNVRTLDVTGNSTTDPIPIYGGHNFVTNMNYMDVDSFGAFDFSDNEIANLPINIPIFGSITDAQSTYISGMWVDSELNIALRHPGSSDCTTIYQGGSRLDYVRDKLWDPEPGDPDQYVVDENPCEEYYAYNEDYSKRILEKPVFAVPFTFDYCSACLFEHPFRIRASETSYQEDLVDNYTVFRQNDYIDLLGSGGPITALVVDKDELYAISQRVAWFVPTRPQTMQTNENITYLGTGERFSIPAKRLATPDHSYGGTNHLFSTVSTEFGTVYVDAKSGKVFMIAQSLAELTDMNVRHLFLKILPLKIKQQFMEVTNTEYPYLDSTIYEYGAGVQSVYDPNKRRLYIHKKDFKVINFGGLLPTNPEPNVVYWVEQNNNKRFIVHENGVVKYPLITDPTYFEDHSFTISYSFMDKAWISFHSFLPSFMWNDSYTFYSSNRDSKVWTHNEGPYQTYYGSISDFVVEFINTPNPAGTKTFGPLTVYANFDIPTTDENFVNNDVSFFDRIWCYNSFQSSGLQTITKKLDSTPFITVDDSNTSVFAEKTNRTWNLNGIRNFITDYSIPISSTNWTDVSSDYFIDKVPNAAAHDFTKSQFEQERLRDHWVGVRLYYAPQKTDPSTPAKLTLDIVNNKSSNSYR